MLKINLPDGSIKEFENSVSCLEITSSIGQSLARAALACKVDNKLVDLNFLVDKSCQFEVITSKNSEGLEILRHSCAHLMAQAVQRIYPNVQITIGPVIENGFYYDFLFDNEISSHDLEKIELEMKKIIKESLSVQRKVLDRNDAIKLFKEKGEFFKAKIIEDLPKDEVISLYSQGEFIDLCRGPHIDNTSKIKPNTFKLTKLAGAYWRGDSNNEMLTRIYGTLFATKEELNDHLYKIEQAQKRDHRKLGVALELFHLQEQAQGMVFWHYKGYELFKTIEQYLRNKFNAWNYKEVKTPQLFDRNFWEKSGHWDKFANEMFTCKTEGKDLALKPMNCPGHIQIFNQQLHSYRDLPLRIAEFGSCHRNEASGALHGLMRLRNFVQDDGHIFCTPAQVESEAIQFNQQLFEVYKDFGFENIIIKLSTRPENRIGDDSLWDKAEKALADSLNKLNLDFSEQKGEGAFYGPKIEYSLKDSLGRVWQCGTLQLDFFLPQRLDATYMDDNNQKQNPVMLHRAVLGSVERFIGILIEEYAGQFPLWLSPTQVAVVPVSEKFNEYANQVNHTLTQKGIRTELDLRNEKITYKIRHFSEYKVPYILVVGEVESKSNSVSVRSFNSNKVDLVTLDNFINQVKKEVENKHFNKK